MSYTGNLSDAMDNGTQPFLYVDAEDGGRFAVTKHILAVNNYTSGQTVTPAAIRAIVQMHEQELLVLQNRLRTGLRSND